MFIALSIAYELVKAEINQFSYQKHLTQVVIVCINHKSRKTEYIFADRLMNTHSC